MIGKGGIQYIKLESMYIVHYKVLKSDSCIISEIKMLMHEQPDLLDLYLGKQHDDLLTVDLSAYAAPSERDQQLDIDYVMDPTDENTLMYLNNFVGKLNY